MKARIAMRRREMWSSGLSWWNLDLVLEEWDDVGVSSMEREEEELLRSVELSFCRSSPGCMIIDRIRLCIFVTMEVDNGLPTLPSSSSSSPQSKDEEL